ncbi:MAG: alkaline phosphatase family protein [Filifactoraceae bacterium]
MKKPSVLLISIDAFNHEFLLNQKDKGLKLPNISKFFLEEGLYSKNGMKSIFPTFTYPCHHSMITGTYSSVHGIHNNIVFDPLKKYKGAWSWFVSENVDNLWAGAKENGYLSASVAFPVSVNAQCDYLIPEFWFAGNEIDYNFINALSHPRNLLKELYDDINVFPTGADLLEESDVVRFNSTKWLLDKKIATKIEEKPFFMSTYFASYDEATHIAGVGSKRGIRALELIDEMVGELIRKVENITGGNYIVCLVSDHGSLDVKFNINPNVLLKEANLILTNEDGTVRDFKAYSQRAGGCSEIRLKDREDTETYNSVKSILGKLQETPNSGVKKILEGWEIQEKMAFPLADFVIVAEKGYEILDNVIGDYCTSKIKQAAQHGFDNEFCEMNGIFCLSGKGIEKNVEIEDVSLIDVAPTLASLMGFSLKKANGKVIL